MYLKIIKPSELESYLRRSKTLLIDIRSLEEYHSSHIEGAINVPQDCLDRYFKSADRSKLYILYCQRGITSLREGKRLAQQDYRIGTLAGGFSVYDRNRKSR